MTIPAVVEEGAIETSWGNAVADQLNGIVAGSTTATTSAGGDITITFGVTYASAPIVVATVLRGTNNQSTCHFPSATTTTTQVVRITENDTLLASTAVTVRWIAIGTLA